jgi:TIR domain
MPSSDAIDTPHAPPSVFLSYASEDRQAAQAMRDALPTFGLEVWYDESELNGGDAWDQKIRRQIRECDYFMAVVSARTEARHEGYFRREWRLAVERSLDMADDHTFILPIVIDDTAQAGARVPEKFLSVQWLRLPGGKPTAAFEALCRRLVSGQNAGLQPPKKAVEQPARTRFQSPPREYPEFPREEPGQRIRFWAHVVGWAFRAAWIFFNRLPKWVRIVAYIWLCVALLDKGCTHDAPRRTARVSPAASKKLEKIAESYQGSSNTADIAKLGVQIAHEFSDEGETNPARSPVLAIPFGAPAGDTAAQKVADSTFALVYGRVAISHRGHVGLSNEPLPTLDSAVALERGRANHSTYVLYGAIDTQEAVQRLTVKIVEVEDGSIVWSKSYPAAGADPTNIAAEVDSKVPSLEDD